MKKLLAIALTIAMIFSMAACGNGGSEEGAEGGANPITVVSREGELFV